jgi:hypothetical protein
MKAVADKDHEILQLKNKLERMQEEHGLLKSKVALCYFFAVFTCRFLR